MKPGLPLSIVLHAAVLGWALISFAGEPPLEAPASDPIDVELLPPSNVSTPKLGSKTGKPSDQITPKETKASTKDQEGKRVGDSKIEEPPPPPPEVKPVTPVEPKPTPVAEQPKPEPPPKVEPPKPVAKVEPPKPVAKVEPPPPPPPAPTEKPEPPKVVEKVKDVVAPKPPEVKEPPKDQNALDKLIAEKSKEEPKKPAEKPAPVKVAAVAPSAKPAPSQSTSKLTGEVSSIQNHVQTGTQSSKTEQHASLGTPTGPNANVKLSQSEMEALIGQLRAQILKCWNPPIGAAEAKIKVSVVFDLSQDGSLRGMPEPASTQPANAMGPALLGSAVRAIKMCQPYTMPADKYAAWARNKIEFDPGDQ